MKTVDEAHEAIAGKSDGSSPRRVCCSQKAGGSIDFFGIIFAEL